MSGGLVAVTPWMSDDLVTSYELTTSSITQGRRVPKAIFDRYMAARDEFEAASAAMDEAFLHAG